MKVYMFNNELTWFFIAVFAFLIFSTFFASKVDIEKEHTKQLEIQLQIAQVSTNNIER